MADGASSNTVIGKDTKIKGEVTFDGSARILGHIEGLIAAKGQLEIGDGGRCKANIDAEKIVIDGKVEGDITARGSLQLNSKADLHGDLVAATLMIAEGATLVGHCRVGPDAVKANGSASMAEAKPKPAVAPAPVAAKK
jgi:cytoskeletal protein CcmA (bactofilin family)